MNSINLAISVCSLFAAIASAIAAWKSATSSKAANTLRPLHNLADHPAEARIMLILSRFA
jgi:phage-related minor tail protein